MNENAWYYDSISAGFSLNIINGSGNKMMPEAPITREQTFAILARTFLLMDKDGNFTDRSKKILSQTPMDRFGEKQELIGTLLFLASNEASGFVNGVIIPVDGGFSAYSGV